MWRRHLRIGRMSSIHEEARDIARVLRGTEGYAQSRRDRKKVEMLFAHMKRILKLEIGTRPVNFR